MPFASHANKDKSYTDLSSTQSDSMCKKSAASSKNPDTSFSLATAVSNKERSYAHNVLVRRIVLHAGLNATLQQASIVSIPSVVVALDGWIW